MKRFLDSHWKNKLKKTLLHYQKKLKAPYTDENKVIIYPTNTQEAEYIGRKSIEINRSKQKVGKIQNKENESENKDSQYKNKNSLTLEQIEEFKDTNCSRKRRADEVSKEEDKTIEGDKLEKRSKLMNSSDGSMKSMMEIKLDLKKEVESDIEGLSDSSFLKELEEKLKII